MKLRFLTILLTFGLFTSLAPADVTGLVVSVTGGDTVKIQNAERQEYYVRLSGIDAPESGQPYSIESREHLASLVAGQFVEVQSYGVDRYGRLIGKVLLDGKDINLEQVEAGYAWWYRHFQDRQPLDDLGQYYVAETEAKSASLGLWSDPEPINPFEWRNLQGSNSFN